ncbi:MAG: hypothetical protein ACFFCS_20325 [Candidatus Hodarchaeota archaeon]
MVICPTCGSNLSRGITKSHLKTKKHLEALKKKNIKPSDDPALKGISEKVSKPRKVQARQDSNLEARVALLERQMSEIIASIRSIQQGLRGERKMVKPNKIRIKSNEILSAIDTCVRSMRGGSGEHRWVDIDDVLGVLNATSEPGKSIVFEIIQELFDKDKIALGEGGNPKYPLVFRNKKFSRIAKR